MTSRRQRDYEEGLKRQAERKPSSGEAGAVLRKIMGRGASDESPATVASPAPHPPEALPLASPTPVASPAAPASPAPLADLRGVELLAALPQSERFLQVPHAILDHLLPMLSPFAQLVYLRLYRLSHGFGSDSCSVSLPTLAAKTAISERSIHRSLAELESRGLVARTAHVFGKGKPQGVTYRVAAPASPAREARAATVASPARAASIKESSKQKIQSAPAPRSEPEEERPMFAIRLRAARLFEAHNKSAEYAARQLRADVIAGLIGEGLAYSPADLDAALEPFR